MVLMDADGCLWMLVGAGECLLVLTNADGCWRMLMDVNAYGC